MNTKKECVYCEEKITDDNYLDCIICKNYVHLICLRRPGTPGDLFGDVFFRFTCAYCTTDGKEMFDRTSLSWSIIIAIALYNLSINSKGLSHHGYFHWQTHISYFIDKNWEYLAETKSISRRKKKWAGSLSGALSRNSPQLFKSGTDEFGESGLGWWKLAHNQTPKWYMKLYQQLKDEKQKEEEIDVCSNAVLPSGSDLKRPRLDSITVCSRSLPYMGKNPHKIKTEPTAETDLSAFLESNLQNIDTIQDFSMSNPANYDQDSVLTSINDFDWPDDLLICSQNDCKPRILQVTNFQETDGDKINAKSIINSSTIKTEIESEDDDNIIYMCRNSLFTKSVISGLSLMDNISDEIDESNLSCQENFVHLMTEYDENILYQKLKIILDSANLNQKIDEIPAWVRRFYRKLCVRKIQRSSGKRTFNSNAIQNMSDRQHHTEILDRFHPLISSSNRIETKMSFYAALAGSAKYEMCESPNTGRILHPFIFRNHKSMPQWVKLMCELQYSVNGEIPSRSTIDFSYLRPRHIGAVNGLLQKCFWHGIDMSECLSYPDFTIVALYKKLVIGCAFLVPDVGHNDAYVSFMAVRPGWQRAGIATFMLYHLTQTCMTRDITLHVSATNPAICLYQKFGFKIEGYILDFYDKYLPLDSKDSKHAFFLRMRR